MDWKVVEIPGKGLGVVAVRDIPAKYRIMVDRAYTRSEARARPQSMDLCPIGATFEEKFDVNELGTESLGSIVCLRYSDDPITWGRFHKRFCTLTPNFRALHPTFEKLFTGANVGRRAQKVGAGRKTVYEMDPRTPD